MEYLNMVDMLGYLGVSQKSKKLKLQKF